MKIIESVRNTNPVPLIITASYQLCPGAVPFCQHFQILHADIYTHVGLGTNYISGALMWCEDCLLPLSHQGHVWQLLEPDGSIDKRTALLIRGNLSYISLWLYLIWYHVTNKVDWLILSLPIWHSSCCNTLFNGTNEMVMEKGIYERSSVNSNSTAQYCFISLVDQRTICGVAWDDEPLLCSCGELVSCCWPMVSVLQRNY